MRRFRRSLGALAVVCAGAMAGGLPAGAAASVTAVTDGLAGPLGLSAIGNTMYVGEAFAGQLTHVDRKGDKQVLVAYPGEEIAGVDAKGRDVTFTHTAYGESGVVTATLEQYRDGTVTVLADLLAYEQEANPDGETLYGFLDLAPECADEVPDFIGGEPYAGIIDSHPYAVDQYVGGGDKARTYLVADAAANAILTVRDGIVGTLAVLPTQPMTITGETAESLGLPACTIGHDYHFEPVPTDVEVHGGHAYVTTLPGGPEFELGGRGALYRISLATGSIVEVADGFFGAVDVAVAPNGDIYVAELLAGTISKVTPAGSVTIAELSLPAAVEWSSGRLLVTHDVFGNGALSSIKL